MAVLLLLPASASAAENPLRDGLRTPSGSAPVRSLDIHIGPGKRLLLQFPAGKSRVLVLRSDRASGLFVRQTRVRWKKGLPWKILQRTTLQKDIRFTGRIRLEVNQTKTFEIGAKQKVVLRSIPFLRSVPQKKIVAVGDIACSSASSAWNGGQGTVEECRGQDVAASAQDPALLLGDLQYPSGTLEQFEEGFDPLWGQKEIYPVPGNHEYYTPGAQGYFDYFLGKGVRASWRTFAMGDWSVFALNSNCEWVSCSEQNEWLRMKLQDLSSKCTLAFWHHPVLSSGVHGASPETLPFWQTFVQGGGDIVLQGHDHHYERFVPLGADLQKGTRGTTSFVVGTGGKSLREVQARDQRSAFVDDTAYGLLRLNLRPQSFSWNWRNSDRGSATCDI